MPPIAAPEPPRSSAPAAPLAGASAERPGGAVDPEAGAAARRGIVALLQTADLLRRRFVQLLAPHGVSLQQYNVLRILRGAGDAPLAAHEIADRMIEQAPGVTRLLDRLEAQGWVTRVRCPDDRRVVHCRLAPGGAALLARVDALVDAEAVAALRPLSAGQQYALAALLTPLRDGSAGQPR
jgi:DNA-binding MarR family transcriptional regulator